MAHYAFLNNDHTTETLREELLVLWNEMGNLTSEEEKDTAAIETKQEEIDAKLPAHVDVGGIKYDVSEQAQNAFTRMQTLIDHAGMALTDEVSVKDVLGVNHTITVEIFNSDMIQYGLHCYTLFNAEPEPVDPDMI